MLLPRRCTMRLFRNLHTCLASTQQWLRISCWSVRQLISCDCVMTLDDSCVQHAGSR